MINTEFGRLVATGAAVFAFALLLGYVRLRIQVMRGDRKPAHKPARESAVPVQ